MPTTRRRRLRSARHTSGPNGQQGVGVHCARPLSGRAGTTSLDGPSQVLCMHQGPRRADGNTLNVFFAGYHTPKPKNGRVQTPSTLLSTKSTSISSAPALGLARVTKPSTPSSAKLWSCASHHPPEMSSRSRRLRGFVGECWVSPVPAVPAAVRAWPIAARLDRTALQYFFGTRSMPSGGFAGRQPYRDDGLIQAQSTV